MAAGRSVTGAESTTGTAGGKLATSASASFCIVPFAASFSAALEKSSASASPSLAHLLFPPSTGFFAGTAGLDLVKLDCLSIDPTLGSLASDVGPTSGLRGSGTEGRRGEAALVGGEELCARICSSIASI